MASHRSWGTSVCIPRQSRMRLRGRGWNGTCWCNGGRLRSAGDDGLRVCEGRRSCGRWWDVVLVHQMLLEEALGFNVQDESRRCIWGAGMRVGGGRSVWRCGQCFGAEFRACILCWECRWSLREIEASLVHVSERLHDWLMTDCFSNLSRTDMILTVSSKEHGRALIMAMTEWPWQLALIQVLQGKERGWKWPNGPNLLIHLVDEQFQGVWVILLIGKKGVVGIEVRTVLCYTRDAFRMSQISRGLSPQSLMSTLSSGEIAVLRAPAALSALDSHLSNLSSSEGTAGLTMIPLESST